MDAGEWFAGTQICSHGFLQGWVMRRAGWVREMGSPIDSD